MAQLPPLNALRAFEVAGRRLNFRIAADELGVTQGAVAQHVRQLEAHLGVVLFERLPKGLAFTAIGRSYHARIESAFNTLRDATTDLRPEPGKVVISVTPTFASKWLIPNLPVFATAHPEIDLRILATESVSSFHSDGIDLAIRQGNPPFGAAINATRLFRQDIIAVAAPELVRDKPLPLKTEAVLAMPKLHDTHDMWPDFLVALGLESRQRDNPKTAQAGLRLSQTALAVDAAAAGQGIALVSRFLVAHDLRAGKLVQVMPDTLSGKQDFYLLSQRKLKRDPSVDAVIEWMVIMAEETEQP